VSWDTNSVNKLPGVIVRWLWSNLDIWLISNAL